VFAERPSYMSYYDDDDNSVLDDDDDDDDNDAGYDQVFTLHRFAHLFTSLSSTLIARSVRQGVIYPLILLASASGAVKAARWRATNSFFLSFLSLLVP